VLKSHNFWPVRERASERARAHSCMLAQCACEHTCAHTPCTGPHIATLCFSFPRHRANLRKCIYITSSATRTQAAVLLQQQQSTSGAGAGAQRESAHTAQVWFERHLSADLPLLSHHRLLSSYAHNVNVETPDDGAWACLRIRPSSPSCRLILHRHSARLRQKISKSSRSSDEPMEALR
jgi:hypothetical protein